MEAVLAFQKLNPLGKLRVALVRGSQTITAAARVLIGFKRINLKYIYQESK